MKQIEKAIDSLKKGGIGVLPTDTIYGLVGSAFSKSAVKRIYKLKKRSPRKPMIILIGSKKDLGLFKIKLAKQTEKLLEKFWPGKVSIILPCLDRKFSYLLCGAKKLAFRLPRAKWLRNLLKKTGPLVAPSANLEGEPPAETINKAKKYFGKAPDFYINKGKIVSLPSTLIEIKNNNVILKRKGAFKI